MITHRIRKHLQDFDFESLFQELGWDMPNENASFHKNPFEFQKQAIAELGKVYIFQITSPQNLNHQQRQAIAAEVQKDKAENICIFINEAHNESFWYWIKTNESKKSTKSLSFFGCVSKSMIV